VALKPTIYKLRIALSDLERNYYDTLSLTVALHPSETPERMMARVLALCINAQDGLVFTKGLSEIDEPDAWVRSMDDNTLLWIEVGEPAPERIKKAVRQAEQVKVYSFNTKSDVWWKQVEAKFVHLDASVYRFDYQQISDLAGIMERTMDMSVTITGESAYVTSGQGEVELVWKTLQASST